MPPRSAAPIASNQRPRLSRSPRLAVATAGDDAIAWAESIGWDAHEGRGFYKLDDWQKWCIRGILSEDANARLCAFVAVLLVPRQNGKNVVLEVVELYAFFVLELRYILHSAHLAETSADHMARLWEAIESDEDLSQRCRRVVANGKERIYRIDRDPETGQRKNCTIRFRTRSKKVGRGGSPQMIVFDEALYLTDEQIQAMLPSLAAQSARPDRPILIYTSSAPVEDSAVLHRIRKAILDGEMPDAWLAEWSTELPADVADLMDAVRQIVDDEAALIASNPGMPYRLDPDWVRSTERPQMSPEAYAVERLGVVFEPQGDHASPIDPETWKRSAMESKITSHDRWSISVADDYRWSSIGIAGLNADGKYHLECVDRRVGTEWAIERAVEIWKAKRIPVRIHKTAPEGSLIARLRQRGVEVVEVSGTEAAQATGQIIDVANSGNVAHLDQPVLNMSVKGAVVRVGQDGASTWSQSRSNVDITPLRAVTVALGGVPEATVTYNGPLVAFR
jgi:phage terminase large subunit-like protein